MHMATDVSYSGQLLPCTFSNEGSTENAHEIQSQTFISRKYELKNVKPLLLTKQIFKGQVDKQTDRVGPDVNGHLLRYSTLTPAIITNM